MNRISVISQSMYFPWCGLFNQILLADTFVHYNDVQYSRGFFNRVQIKTSNGMKWMTVPLKKHSQKKLINEVPICYKTDWVLKHRNLLIQSLKGTPFIQDVIDIFDEVTKIKHQYIGELSKDSIECVSQYLGIHKKSDFLDSSDLNVSGSSSKRLLALTKKVLGTTYLTGHGAYNYLSHELFEAQGVGVEYIDYSIEEYQQQHGAFTPYVSCLDAIAHLGKDTTKILQSNTIDWRAFNERTRKI